MRKQDGSVWLFEAKGSEGADGDTQNIDDQAENKFNALRDYATKHGLNWGFVRNYDGQLFINNTEWYEDMSDPHWVMLDEGVKL